MRTRPDRPGTLRRTVHSGYRRWVRGRLSVLQQQRLKLVLWHGWGYRVLIRCRHLPARRKVALLRRFLAVDWSIPHAHKPIEISHVVASILEPRPGASVVEAGCWNGGSTAKLSLACAMAGVRLHVYDSFAGVEPGASPFSGAYAATLTVVRDNVRAYGSADVCEFHPGWFCDTLRPETVPPEVKTVYVDCDLAKGTREVLAAVVPSLAPGGRVFSQDVHIPEVRDLLADADAWRSTGVGVPGIEYLGENTAELRF